MDAVTYPDHRTVAFVDRFLIAHRETTASRNPALAGFAIQYTPTVIIVDGRGKEHHRTVGFLPPEEFIPSLMLGIGKSWSANERYDRAILILDILLLEFPRSRSASEASQLRRTCEARRPVR